MRRRDFIAGGTALALSGPVDAFPHGKVNANDPPMPTLQVINGVAAAIIDALSGIIFLPGYMLFITDNGTPMPGCFPYVITQDDITYGECQLNLSSLSAGSHTIGLRVETPLGVSLPTSVTFTV